MAPTVKKPYISKWRHFRVSLTAPPGGLVRVSAAPGLWAMVNPFRSLRVGAVAWNDCKSPMEP